jgi:hypothetical protein
VKIPKALFVLLGGAAAVNVFNIIGRYFWLLCLGISAYQYVLGMRSLASRDPNHPRASAVAIALHRWIAVGCDGWEILVGGVIAIAVPIFLRRKWRPSFMQKCVV